VLEIPAIYVTARLRVGVRIAGASGRRQSFARLKLTAMARQALSRRNALRPGRDCGRRTGS
jgi:hypothetical protein